tara:strand:+ start:787 stop:1092 length:306 start_codon:yes stop_codon:yes gene_type:complete
MKYNERTKTQQEYIDSIVEYANSQGRPTCAEVFNRIDLREVSMNHKGSAWIPNWITHDQSRRSGRGKFYIPEVAEMRKENSGPIEIIPSRELEPIGATVEV